VEGVAIDGLLANLVRAGTLANAAVCNICITVAMRIKRADYPPRLAGDSRVDSLLAKLGYEQKFHSVRQVRALDVLQGLFEVEATCAERIAIPATPSVGKRALKVSDSQRWS
jgi:hypothetical protein